MFTEYTLTAIVSHHKQTNPLKMIEKENNALIAEFKQ